jgi:hypothetical protein
MLFNPLLSIEVFMYPTKLAVLIGTFLYFLLVAPSWAKPGSIHRNRHPVAGSYIVTLEGERAERGRAAELIAPFGGRVKFTVDLGPVQAFVVEAMTEQAALALTHHPRVSTVEEDAFVSVSQEPYKFGTKWHLDRIDQRGPAAETPDAYQQLLRGPTPVQVYILDTGVWAGHSEFSLGNVRAGINVASGTNPGGEGSVLWNGQQYPRGNNPTFKPGEANAYWLSEGVGHGTAVASLVGGKTLGVMPGVSIVPVETAFLRTSISRL